MKKQSKLAFPRLLLKLTVIEYNACIAQGLREKHTFQNMNKQFQPEEMR